MSDPKVWVSEAEAGNLRNTFTGIRATFANKAIHKLIVDTFLPFRREMFMRPEFASAALWEEPMITLIQEWLSEYVNAIRRVTHKSGAGVSTPLKDRREKLNKHLDRMNGAEELEAIALAGDASHGDQQVTPATQQIPTLQFDFTGNHQDYPQPTPGRMASTSARVIITGLDFLTVAMTNSPSANAPRMVNRYDAADWITQLSDLYRVAQEAATNGNPHLPTGILRSQLDASWNADRSFDVPLDQGDGRFGEQPSAAASDAATS